MCRCCTVSFLCRCGDDDNCLVSCGQTCYLVNVQASPSHELRGRTDARLEVDRRCGKVEWWRRGGGLNGRRSINRICRVDAALFRLTTFSRTSGNTIVVRLGGTPFASTARRRRQLRLCHLDGIRLSVPRGRLRDERRNIRWGRESHKRRRIEQVRRCEGTRRRRY